MPLSMIQAGREAGRKMASERKKKKKVDAVTGADPGAVGVDKFAPTKGQKRVKRANKNQVKRFKSLFFVE